MLSFFQLCFKLLSNIEAQTEFIIADIVACVTVRLKKPKYMKCIWVSEGV